MKYNEFRALNAVLENNGSSIEEFKDDKFLVEVEMAFSGVGNISEESEESDELKNDKSGLNSPRYARTRNKIFKNAKNYLEIANEKLINKYSNMHLENIKNITNKAAGLKKDGRNPEEIIAALEAVGQQSMATNQKMWKQVESGLDKLEQNFSKRVAQLSNNDKLSENSKFRLDTYWTLLLAQVKGKLFSNIIKKQQKFIENVTESNPELKDFVNKISGGENMNIELGKVKKQAEEEKRKFKEADKKPEDGAEGEGAGAEGEVKKDPQPGEKYKYKTKSGNEIKVEITEIGKEGGNIAPGMVQVKDVNNKTMPLSIKNLGEKIEAEEKPVEKTETEA